MKFWETFRFEIAYALRLPATWIYLACLAALAYWVGGAMLVDGALQDGERHANAPIAVAAATVIVSMFGLFVTAALVGDAATRDVRSRMTTLLFAAPLAKAEYLGGRFLGSLVVNALMTIVVPFGFVLAVETASLEAGLVGPFRLATYVRPYLFFLLPDLFVSAAVLFALATLSRQTLAAYTGALLLFLSTLVGEELLAEQMAHPMLGSLMDPLGFTIVSELWERWTPFEMNTLPVVFDGILVWNRALWLAVGVGVLAFTHARFRFAHHAAGGRRRRKQTGEAGAVRRHDDRVAVPTVARSFGAGTRLRQVGAVAGRAFRHVATSRTFLVLVAGTVVAVLIVGRTALDDNWGAPTWPLTQLVTWLLGSFLVAISVSLVAGFYAGELVWQERDAGWSEVADAAPVPGWTLFTGKFVALGLVLVLLQAVLMAAGLLVQALQGYYHFELSLYLRVLFGLRLADYLLFAALAMFVHVLVDHKYAGHLIVVLVYAFTAFAARLGVDHHLLVYGSDPGWIYSDLSGFGPFLGPWLWFKLYWAAWAALLAVAANLLWVRGREEGFRRRLGLARQRLTRSTAAVAVAAAGVVAATGGFIFYNTNVLNTYRDAFENAALHAEYERRYGRYAGALQPQVTGTQLHVEIHPARRTVDVRGTYRLENRTAAAIDSVHLFVHPDVETGDVTFGGTARAVLEDDVLGHRIYALGRPLAPGDTVTMRFDVRFAPRGFRNGGVNTSVVGNGTYFDHTGGRNPNHRRWLPVVGYQPNRELTGDAARRAHGLAPRPPRAPDDPAALHDPAGREWIDFEAVVGTDEDQIAVAPGTLRATWTENGRRYFRYATEAPVKNAYAIFSADYAVHEAQWNGVDVQIFHQPAHTFNLDRMVRSVTASLDYYTEHFGPYPHRHLRIVEFPRYGNFAHAYPGTISYAEGFGFLTRVSDSDGRADFPFTVVAHEVAHQWWGYQVVPAAVEGAPFLSEVLAQYSALMVLEKTYGPEPVRSFLDLMQIEYLNRRTGRDVPLLHASDQQNLVYRKGALAMYALRSYVGERQVNAALRRFLEAHRSGEPPYPTALDLYGELQAVTPDSLRYLLVDLFETNTLWSLRTTKARAEPAGTGRWRVEIDVAARKTRVDSTGIETEVPMGDWVEIGVFAADEDAPLYLQKHRLRSGRQTITVTVPREPARAGLDPHGLLIDRDLTGNVVRVEP